MLRSVASQLEKGLFADRLSPAFERLYSDCYMTGTGRQATLDEVMRLIGALSTATSKAYVVLDALDECKQREKLLGAIVALTEAAANVKLFVTSRRESDIIEALTEDAFKPISIIDDAVTHDIGLYVNSVLNNDDYLRKLPQNLKRHIQCTLMDGAKSMRVSTFLSCARIADFHIRFRWVKCQIDTIRPLKRVSVIKEALKTLPKTLDETYERILKRFIDTGAEDNIILLKRICIFIAFAKRPMRLNELAQAIVIEIRGQNFDEDAAFCCPEDLLSLCHPLIAVSPHTGLLGFVHYSVQEFLLSERLLNAEGEIKMFALDAKSSHVEIAQLCLSFLNYDDFSMGPCTTYEAFKERTVKYPFLKYAADYWPFHSKVQETESIVSDLILKLFIPQKTPRLASMLQASSDLFTYCPRNGSDFLKLYYLQIDPRPIGYTMNSLALASLLGLNSVLKGIVENGADINALGTSIGNPIHSAAFYGHLTTVKILVDLGADLNYSRPRDGGTALMIAIKQGNREIVEYLLKMKADVTIADSRNVTALHLAAFRGDVDTVRRLVELGADINVGKELIDSQEFSKIRSPLWMALVSSQVEAAIFLIASGASLCGIPIVDWANALFDDYLPRAAAKERAARFTQELSSLGHHMEIVEEEDEDERLKPDLPDSRYHPLWRTNPPVRFRAVERS